MVTCIQTEWLDRHPEVLAWLSNQKVSHPMDRAHPYPPGSGPPGQTCGTCAKLCVRRYARNYYKCRVLMKHWSNGFGTDVKLKDQACMSWEPATETVDLLTVRGRHRVVTQTV